MSIGPLLTCEVHEQLTSARKRQPAIIECSLDLGRARTQIAVHEEHWQWQGANYPYLERCKDRTIYHWTGTSFEPVARYSGALIKLVPTEWGPPTFEIDGIKMLPTAKTSPYEDAQRKVALIKPESRRVLDTCGGLGYFAAWCLQLGAAHISSFEKNADVLWLRSLNPWSPEGSGGSDPRLTVAQGDISQAIDGLQSSSFDAVLHDPPRFGIAGELYSQAFYDQLARVLKRNGMLFHYVGTPNKLTSGRDVPQEVATRLQRAGFTTRPTGDGILASKR